VTELSICSGCGVIVDASRSACEACGTPYGTPALRAVPQPDGGYWVAVRATFTCNACRFDVPLNHFELGEGVVCTRCGLEQRFERSNWHELVDFAHAAGDLGAPGPEGRFPEPGVSIAKPEPFADVGVSTTWAVEGEYRACPGNPLCRECGAPRVVFGKRDGTIDVGCSNCDAKSTYELPSGVRFRRLAGVLADEHEAGRNEATTIEESGVVVLRCPNCSAPLTGVKDEDGVVTCAYCRVPCRISSRTHARAGHKQTPVKTWWLYFEEPSPLRRKLVKAAKKKAERKAGQSTEDEGFDGSRAAEAQAAEQNAIVPLLVVFGISVIVGGLMFYQSGKKAEQDAARATPPGDDVLLRWSFSMPSEDASELFRVEPRPGVKVELQEKGVFKEVSFGGAGGPTYSIALLAGEKFDTDRVLERLAKIAPNRLREDAVKQREINTGRTLLRVDPRPTPMYRARVEVMTWVEGEAGVAAADAFFAAVRHAALDGPEPDAAQLRIINGPPLSELARFDVTMPIEDAAKGFVAALPHGKCATTTDLLARTTDLICTAEVDHPVIDAVRFAWPSVEKARQKSAMFVKQKGASDPIGCLEGALGPGEKKVLDFASNKGELSWPLGERGDRAVLDGAGLRLVTREGAKPEEVGDWTKSYERIVGVLASCTDRN